MLDSAANLLAEVNKHEWYHRIDLGNGVVTPGRAYDVMWEPTLAFMKKVSFADKRVLDVGCWDGLFSFAAERMGAASVVGTDIVPRPTFQLAASALGSHAVFRQCSVYRLASLFPSESFDIVIFNGVLYHLMAPLLALISINGVLRPQGTLLMESACYSAEPEEPFIFVSYGADQLYEGDASSCTFPTAKAFRHMFNMALFTVERQDCYRSDGTRGRILMEGRRRERLAADLFYEYAPDVV